MDTKKRQQIIIDHYGIEHQLNKLIEESAELIQAISKYNRGKSWEDDAINLTRVVEEMADVKNLIQQLELGSEFIGNEVEFEVYQKVNRQIKRIEEED